MFLGGCAGGCSGRVWGPADRDVMPEPVGITAVDTWSGPQEFSDDISWESYPSRFGEMELPVSSPGALTTVEWPGSTASREQVVATIELCLGVMERDGAVILAHAVADGTMDAYLESLEAYNSEDPHGHGPGRGSYGDGSVVARSKASLPLAAHPGVMGVCEGVLGHQVLTMDQHELQRRLVHSRVGQEDDSRGGTRVPFQLQVQAFIGQEPGAGPQVSTKTSIFSMRCMQSRTEFGPLMTAAAP